MNKKKELFAAIDVGSNSIRIAIAQINIDGNIDIIEDLKVQSYIGRDTFSYGRIQVDTIHETCDMLKGFVQIMKDYRIKNYRAVCTSGIREAENKEYVLEQIRIRTGLELEIINNAQERFLMYQAIREIIVESKKSLEKNMFIMDIRAGGIEISVFSKGSLKFTEYIKIGSLRLREILASLERKTLDFPSIMEEFIESRIHFYKTQLQAMNINAFIGLGGELRSIIEICNNKYKTKDDNFLTKLSLEKLYENIKLMTTDQITSEFNLTREDAQVLLPCVVLFYKFLQTTKANGIIAPLVSLRNGILSDFADEFNKSDNKYETISDILSSVWYTAEKYFIDTVHCKHIEKLSLSIYDQTTKIHRLGDRERLYLRVASILHDIGKYMNLSKHDLHSLNIIRAQDIMGFSDREREIVANIARYHSEEIPQKLHENYLLLEDRDQIIVSKLAGIIRISEALDISHRQKIQEINITNTERELILNVKINEDILLEEWSFASHMTFFEEVMGIKPILRRKG
jgi:exopolyphosphatase/guanosine-5'-triphosphate,3'-diphosphate pyrophosphatase